MFKIECDRCKTTATAHTVGVLPTGWAEVTVGENTRHKRTRHICADDLRALDQFMDEASGNPVRVRSYPRGGNLDDAEAENER